MGARSSQSRGPGLNNSDGHLLEYFRQNFGTGGGGIKYVPPVLKGLTATGGVISDYTEGNKVYRSHIFTSSGIFNVTELGTFGDTVEYLVVAGGGGGGGRSGGGGGAGGLRTNLSGHPLAGSVYPVSITNPYTITVGGGGFGGSGDPGNAENSFSVPGTSGSLSEFYPTPVSHPSPARIRADGGGGGTGCNDSPEDSTGASGGGAGAGNPSPSAQRAGNTPPYSPAQGNSGGNSGGVFTAGGGGGAGGAGLNAVGNAPGDKAGNGGLGSRVSIGAPPSSPSPIGAPGPGSGASATGWFAGGGGGGNYVGAGASPPVVIGYGGAGPSGTSPYAGGGNGSKTTPVPGNDGTSEPVRSNRRTKKRLVNISGAVIYIIKT